MLTLFHGGERLYLERVISSGFREEDKMGNGYGCTYGTGLYFSDDPKVARCYSDTDAVLEVNVTGHFFPIDNFAGYPTRKSQNKFDRLKLKIPKEFIGYRKQVRGEREFVLFDAKSIVSTLKIQYGRVQNESMGEMNLQ